MNMRRRAFVATGLGAVVSLAGCLGFEDPSGVLGSDADGESDVEQPPPSAREEDIESHGTGENATTNGSADSADGDPGSENTPTVTLSSNDPVTVVETFYEALYTPDLSTANGLIHPESPAPMYTEDVVSSFDSFDYTLEGVELVDESASAATVAFVLILEGSDGVVRRNNVMLELRTDEQGNWNVWAMKRGGEATV